MLLLAMAAGSAASLCRGPADFHYPDEEAAEWEVAAASVPTVVEPDPGSLGSVQVRVDISSVSLACRGSAPRAVPVGASFPCGGCTWQIRGVLPGSGSARSVAMEHKFARWGVLYFVSATNDSTVAVRMPVGLLTDIQQPLFNFSGAYMLNISNSLRDRVTEMASAATADGEPDYPSIAALLAPQRDYVAVSHAADVVKFAVAYSGRVKCASSVLAQGEDSNTGGIAELTDLHAAFPEPQKVVFEPSDFLTYVSYSLSPLAPLGARPHGPRGMTTGQLELVIVIPHGL